MTICVKDREPDVDVGVVITQREDREAADRAIEKVRHRPTARHGAIALEEWIFGKAKHTQVFSSVPARSFNPDHQQRIPSRGVAGVRHSEEVDAGKHLITIFKHRDTEGWKFTWGLNMCHTVPFASTVPVMFSPHAMYDGSSENHIANTSKRPSPPDPSMRTVANESPPEWTNAQ